MLAPRSWWVSGRRHAKELRSTHGHGADEVFAPHEEVRQDETGEDGEDPGPNEAFDGLLGGQFDELGAADGDPDDVGEDVVRDDQGGW